MPTLAQRTERFCLIHLCATRWVQPAGRPGDIVRGVVDCLIVRPDGSATVLEFKTGEARPEHQAQAALYGEAMNALLGLTAVSVKVLYS